ncbi:MAG: FG-GAP repeat protein [Phycisphaerales bacterium]|nr:FG-GAP repeat protein [Phycisphaerales bacterium]
MPSSFHRSIAAIALIVPLISGVGVAQGQTCVIRQADRLTAPGTLCDGSGCRLGFSVAISGDGNTAISGSPGETSALGAAYVFVRQGERWVPQGDALRPLDGTGVTQNFGSSVAISADGNTAVVGAYGDNSSRGAAYVFTRDSGVWTQQGPKILPLNPVGQLGFFGIAAAMSQDGNTFVIGAEGDGGYAGAAYVFQRSGTTWTQQAKFTSINGISVTQFFGSAVAISGDGNTVAIGARGDDTYKGAAYMFVRAPGASTWTNQGGKLVPADGLGVAQYFGCSVALSGNGDVALVGAWADGNGVGAVYNYNRFGGFWLNQQKFRPIGFSGAGRYGSSVALSIDGTTAMVGAYADAGYNGAVYKCVRTPTAGWTQPAPKILPANPSGAGTFGFGVGVSASGQRAFVGAYTEANATGAAYGIDLCFTPCRADFDGSGAPNAADIFEFLNAWFAGEPRADFNQADGLTAADIFDFLNTWFAGCP